MTHPHNKKSRLVYMIALRSTLRKRALMATARTLPRPVEWTESTVHKEECWSRDENENACSVVVQGDIVVFSPLRLSLQMIREQHPSSAGLYPLALFYQSLPPPFHWTKTDLEPIRPPFVQAERFMSRMSLVITSVRPYGLLYQEGGVPVNTKKEPPPGGGILCPWGQICILNISQNLL